MSSDTAAYAKHNGLKLRDAKKDTTVEVEKSDIRKGRPGCKRRCVFANAAVRSGVDEAFFNRSTAYLVDRDAKTMDRYLLSKGATKAIKNFDASGMAEPGKFVLKAPFKSQTLAAALKRSKKRPGRHQPAGTKTTRKSVAQRASVPIVSRYAAKGK